MDSKICKNSNKILVGLSGGVDSSVTAALLKEKGYQVEGAYMRCWSEGPYCTADRDQADAARVAATLSIPFHVFNFEEEYKAAVIDYFFSEYEAGRTPNPDVMCNKEIKFGIFLKKAEEMGFDYIATGHYARITNGNGYHLFAGLDNSKDQSYFLYYLGQKELEKAIFPLGEYTKKEVRKLARRFNLPTADKPDSTGICFVGPADVKEFLMQKIKPRQGDIITVDGRVIGEHIGLPFYTIGQREGLSVSQNVPYYVVGKDLASNRLIVAPFGHESLFKTSFTVSEVHWGGQVPKMPLKALVKLRYQAESVDCTVKNLADDKAEVNLIFPQRAITPGQSAVFYDRKGEVLGGGIID